MRPCSWVGLPGGWASDKCGWDFSGREGMGPHFRITGATHQPARVQGGYWRAVGEEVGAGGRLRGRAAEGRRRTQSSAKRAQPGLGPPGSPGSCRMCRDHVVRGAGGACEMGAGAAGGLSEKAEARSPQVPQHSASPGLRKGPAFHKRSSEWNRLCERKAASGPRQDRAADGWGCGPRRMETSEAESPEASPQDPVPTAWRGGLY